jgi:poly-gamma-glutamate synthesis protein (capsule biosynthesis protein)
MPASPAARFGAVAMVGLLSAAMAACGGGAGEDEGVGGGSPRTSPAASAAAGQAATQPPKPTGNGDPKVLTMAFGGDVHFEDYLKPLARDPHGLDVLRSSLGTTDLAMVNLETAITERGTKVMKSFNFRAPASALTTLANAGVDVVTMANNHGADYGTVGLRDTFAAKESSPIPVVGIGADADEAFRPATLQAKGLRIAVFGGDQVFEQTLAQFSARADSPGVASSAPVTRLAREVRRAAKSHDLVVVYLHWGMDYQKCPEAAQTSTARALEEAGADIVVGGHSHRINAAGWLGRSYVAYGLGNFVWWRSHEPDSQSGVLTLSVSVPAALAKASGRSVVTAADWAPMLIGPDGIPADPGPAARQRLHEQWDRARACSNLRDSP